MTSSTQHSKDNEFEVFTPCKVIMTILDSGYFMIATLYPTYWIQDYTQWISDSKSFISRIPDSKDEDSGFQNKYLLNSGLHYMRQKYITD